MAVVFPSFGQLETALESFLNRVVADKEVDLKDDTLQQNMEMKRALAALLTVTEDTMLAKSACVETKCKEDKVEVKEEEDWNEVSDTHSSEDQETTASTPPPALEEEVVVVKKEKDDAMEILNALYDSLRDGNSNNNNNNNNNNKNKDDDVDHVVDAVLPPTPDEVCECHGVAFSECTTQCYCVVCTDSFTPGPRRVAHAITCHQYLCDSCLTDTLSYSIRNGQVNNINCPNCCFHLLPREVARRVSREDMDRYYRFLLDKHLSCSDNVHRCENPGCDNAVVYDNPCALKDWQCESCGATCAYCRLPAHIGPCAAKRKFMAAEARQKAWAAFNPKAKRCPECKTLIIKNGGCRHMTCRNRGCGHEFCWHCKRPWKTHEVCFVDVLAVGGMVVVSPVVIGVGVTAAVAFVVTLAASGPMLPSVLFKGKSVIKGVWKLGRKVYDRYF